LAAAVVTAAVDRVVLGNHMVQEVTSKGAATTTDVFHEGSSSGGSQVAMFRSTNAFCLVRPPGE
jgi:hypothetical protein